MAFNYSKLRGRIREYYGTETAFAEALEVSTVTLSNRFNHGLNFKQTEIMKSAELLNIAPEDLAIYFFDKDVQ